MKHTLVQATAFLSLCTLIYFAGAGVIFKFYAMPRDYAIQMRLIKENHEIIDICTAKIQMAKQIIGEYENVISLMDQDIQDFKESHMPIDHCLISTDAGKQL